MNAKGAQVDAEMDSRFEAVRLLLDQMTRRGVPGLSIVVVREDGQIWSGSAGWADLLARRRMSTGTACLWFSMTKIVTATAVMQLADRGRLRLADPVRQYIPAFPLRREGVEVTIRHLLSHSSGLANPMPIRWVHPASRTGPDPHAFTLRLLTKHSRLRSAPGAKVSYSNLGYLALGEVIAAASGQAYEDFVRRHILDPLQMTRTDYSLKPDVPLATAYQPRWSPMAPLLQLVLPTGTIGRSTGGFVAFNRFYVDGPAYGGLVGPADDAARFLAMHLNEGSLGGVRILSQESVAAMQRITARGSSLEVGLGWFRRGSDQASTARYLEHLGGGAGFWNMMRIYPERRLGIVVMGNATSYDHERIAAAVLAAASA